MPGGMNGPGGMLGGGMGGLPGGMQVSSDIK